jgi:hypothetical protein
MASRFSVVGSFQYFLIVVPELQETFVVRVAIDQRLNTIGMLQRQAGAHRRAPHSIT